MMSRDLALLDSEAITFLVMADISLVSILNRLSAITILILSILPLQVFSRDKRFFYGICRSGLVRNSLRFDGDL